MGGRDVTKVLREANSPGRDKENLGFLSGSCQIPRSQALDRICNRGRPPSARGRWDVKKKKKATGQREEGGGKGRGQRADGNMTCPEWPGPGGSREGIPRGLLQ